MERCDALVDPCNNASRLQFLAKAGLKCTNIGTWLLRLLGLLSLLLVLLCAGSPLFRRLLLSLLLLLGLLFLDLRHSIFRLLLVRLLQMAFLLSLQLLHLLLMGHLV